MLLAIYYLATFLALNSRYVGGFVPKTYKNKNPRTICFSTESNKELRLEDKNVPIAHAGLHDFLYGDLEDHGAAKKSENKASTEVFNGSRAYNVLDWLDSFKGSKVAGVFSIVGSNGKVNFVGISRNVELSLAYHYQSMGPNKVALVKIFAFKYPKKTEMETMKADWLKKLDYVPEGNTEQLKWAESSKDTSTAMSKEARNNYEESKLKMRKAMADSALLDEYEANDQSLGSEGKLKKAVNEDDWSEVINEQTERTRAPETKTTPQGLLMTGFSAPEKAPLELTVHNVDKVLDEVRPYLIADGGNCKVVAVDADLRVISLALQGACGSCPSSTTTMQMGIERVLNENFEDLRQVVRVEENGFDLNEVTLDLVEGLLDPIKPAIKAMNGMVKVVGASQGVVTLAYSGSPKIKYGIELACLDNPLIQQVKFVDYN